MKVIKSQIPIKIHKNYTRSKVMCIALQLFKTMHSIIWYSKTTQYFLIFHDQNNNNSYITLL